MKEIDCLSVQQYSEDELTDSLIVDRAGCTHGYVAGFKISSNEIVINTYLSDTKRLEVPDEEELTRRLFEVAPRKGIFKRQLTKDEFDDWIRELLDLPRMEPVSVEHLVICANLQNIAIPMKTEETEMRIEGGTIEWSAVDKVTSTDLGKCVLLKDAMNGKEDGEPSSTEVTYRTTEELSGKLVLDSEAKIVGYALQFLIGSPPGLLIDLGLDTEEQKNDAEAVKHMLIPSRFKNERQLLATVKKDLNLESINGYRARAITIWAKRNKIEVQGTRRVQKSGVEVQVDWDKIAKISDVIFLNAPIRFIRSIDSTNNPTIF